MEQIQIGELLLNQIELRLRDHQQVMADMTLELIAAGHKKILLLGTCGIGKTEIAAWLLRRMAQAGQKAFFVADRKVLVNQTSARLNKYGVQHGIIQADNTRDENSLIMVCSKQSLKDRHFNSSMQAFVFIDECHENIAWIKEMQKTNSRFIFIGLTGSPFTRGFRKLWDCLVPSPSIKWLTDNKFLTTVKHFACREIDMRDVKVDSMGEWDKGETGERAVAVIGDVVSEYKKFSMQHFGGYVKAILFGVSIKHCETQAQAFSDAGIYATTISANTDEKSRKDILSKFASGEIKIITSCEVLAKGFDAPDVMIGMGARPYRKSFNKFIQSKERIARAHATKPYALWLDFSGNMDRFYEQYKHFRDHGITDIEQLNDDIWKEPKSKINTGDNKELICPDCHFIMDHPAPQCPNCDFEFKKKTGNIEIINVKGKMVDLDAETPLPQVDKVAILAMFKGYAIKHNYKIGWASQKFKDMFESFPPYGLLDQIEPIEPTVDILNWIKSRNIAWYRSQKNKENKIGENA